MTQRNPMNERYQNTGEKKPGKTRKSAASAKPTTKAASSVHIEGKAPKPKGRFARAQRQAQQPKKSNSSQDRYFQPDTPEYRKWRRIWWGLIIVALAFTSLSFFATGLFASRAPMYAMLGVGYAALIAAIIIDVTKVRKIRNAAASSGSKSKVSKKQRKAEEARRAEEAARAKEAEEAKRAAKAEKKSRSLFGKKKEGDSASENAES